MKNKLISKCQTGTNKGGISRRIYNYVNPTQAYPRNLKQAADLFFGSLLYGGNQTYEVEDSVADAAWRKRLGLEYDPKFLPENEDGSVRLPKQLENEIPVDTNFIKNRIANNEKLLKYYTTKRPNAVTNKEVVQVALDLDKQTLDSLRHTYKTGEPVVINENAHNSRNLIDDGQFYPEFTPLNVLQNFTIQWDPKTKQMKYRDTYDFNKYDWGVPGKSFEIKGSIDRSKNKQLKTKKK